MTSPISAIARRPAARVGSSPSPSSRARRCRRFSAELRRASAGRRMIGEMSTLPRTEHAVARSLAETADPQAALAQALAAIGESLGWRFGAVWEPPADRPEALRCVEVWQGAGVDSGDFAAASRGTVLAP